MTLHGLFNCVIDPWTFIPFLYDQLSFCTAVMVIGGKQINLNCQLNYSWVFGLCGPKCAGTVVCDLLAMIVSAYVRPEWPHGATHVFLWRLFTEDQFPQTSWKVAWAVTCSHWKTQWRYFYKPQVQTILWPFPLTKQCFYHMSWQWVTMANTE